MPRSTPPAKATGNDLAVALLITAVVAGAALLGFRYIKARQEESFSGPSTSVAAPGPGVLDGEQLLRGLPVPSPDGQTLYWTGWREGGGGLLAMPSTGGDVTLLDSGRPAKESRASVSPDGHLVAWLADDESLGFALIRVYDIPKGAPQGLSQLHVRADPAAGLHWWPVSEELLYVETESHRLMRRDVVGGKPALAAEGVQCAAGGEGLRIGLTRDGAVAYDDLSRHVLGTPNRSACLDYVVPAPDGQVVAMVEAPYSATMHLATLLLLPAAQQDRPRNARGAPIWAVYVPQPGNIEWSPDSSRILFYWRTRGARGGVGILRDDATADAAVISAADGSVVRLLHWPGSAKEHRAAWLDAKTVLYLEDTGPQTLWRVDSDSGKAEALLGDAHAAAEAEVESK